MLPGQALDSELHIHMLVKLIGITAVGAVLLVVSKLSTFTQLAVGRHGLGVTSWIQTVWPQSLGTTLKKTMGCKRIIDYINNFQE